MEMAVGSKLGVTSHWIILADTLTSAGYQEQAQAALEAARSLIEETGERYFEADWLRVQGKIHSEDDGFSADRCYREAVRLASGQEAKWEELSAAVALCRSHNGRARTTAIREILAPLHAWFDEGHDLPLMQAARMLLAELNQVKRAT